MPRPADDPTRLNLPLSSRLFNFAHLPKLMTGCPHVSATGDGHEIRSGFFLKLPPAAGNDCRWDGLAVSNA
jgi:hypothetical protein